MASWRISIIWIGSGSASARRYQASEFHGMAWGLKTLMQQQKTGGFLQGISV
jgi:hypothetical protein